MMLREQRLVDEVDINLPAGETVRFRLHGQRLSDDGASCYVIKDAGDDPDVTNGAEIHVFLKADFFTLNRVVVQGGAGIGRVTKPGLAVAIGGWAINPVPRRMITEAVKEVFAMRCMPVTFTVTVSIPDGEARAKRPSTSGWASSAGSPSWGPPASCGLSPPRPGPPPSTRLSTSPLPVIAGRLSFPPGGRASWWRKSTSGPAIGDRGPENQGLGTRDSGLGTA